MDAMKKNNNLEEVLFISDNEKLLCTSVYKMKHFKNAFGMANTIHARSKYCYILVGKSFQKDVIKAQILAGDKCRLARKVCFVTSADLQNVIDGFDRPVKHVDKFVMVASPHDEPFSHVEDEYGARQERLYTWDEVRAEAVSIGYVPGDYLTRSLLIREEADH